MSQPYLTNAEIENLEARTWAVRSTPVSGEEGYRMVKELVRLRGQNAMLTDMVVTAAALWFGQMPKRDEDPASESLHEVATALVAENPRLRNAFRSEL